MKHNKITVIKTIKKELYFGIFVLIAIIILGLIFKNIIFIVLFLFYIIRTIYRLFHSNDFEILEDGFNIVGINKKIHYKNTEIENIRVIILGQTNDYKIYINKKKYNINISDENKYNLINYFEKTSFKEKELFIDNIKKKTVFF